MQVRILTHCDAEAFIALRRERLIVAPRAFAESVAEHDSLSPEAIAARLKITSGDNFVVGAFVDDQLAGIAGFSRILRAKSRHKGVIWGVFVRENARGKGVGRALLQALIEHARREPGLEQIQLTVSVGQTAARSLYLSLGFEVFGHERHALKVDGEYVDEDHMVLWL